MKGENPSRFAFFPALIASPVIQAAIADEASRRGISTDAARQQAQRFLQEIAARYSPATMRFAARCFAWLWPRLYDAIEVYRFEQVTKQEATARIVYIPAHRSHLDYLLLSYLLHDNGFTPPHIAAGANLNLPVTAEGVETDTIAERLAALGCAKAQGWNYGKPLSIADTRRMLAARGLLHAGTTEPDLPDLTTRRQVG